MEINQRIKNRVFENPRRAIIVGVALIAGFSMLATHSSIEASREAPRDMQSSTGLKTRALKNFLSLPLSFEANRGQAAKNVNFLTRANGFEVMLDRKGATFLMARLRPKQGEAPRLQNSQPRVSAQPEAPRFDYTPLRMILAGASVPSQFQAHNRLPGVVNYYRGNDRSRWRRGVPTYGQVEYRNVYPGIDLAYHGNRGRFEFDFDARPDSDPSRIKLVFNGLTAAAIGSDGSAILTTSAGEILLKRPDAYQAIGGARKEVSVTYRIAKVSPATKATAGKAEITLALGNYDRSQTLTIDPQLVFSGWLGGSLSEVQGVTLDSAGNAYVTGLLSECMTCIPFPTTSGTYEGITDAFVTEINANGTQVIYSTVIGGSALDEGGAIAVDGSGAAYVTGFTDSSNFPATVGTTTAPGGTGDGWVGVFYPSTASSPNTPGALMWASYIGGSNYDQPYSIAVQSGCPSNCNPYIAGQTFSSNFTGNPVLIGAADAFVLELQADGSAPVYSVLIGGSAGELGPGSGTAFAAGIVVDSIGSAYIGGGTDATNFPTTVGPAIAGSRDGFVAKLAAGGSVTYARLIGGSDVDAASGVAINPTCTMNCPVYVNGQTFSKDFPVSTTPAPYQSSISGIESQFLTEVSADGSTLVYSTYLGGSPLYTQPAFNGITIDSAGDAYVTGDANAGFPLQNQLFSYPAANGLLYAIPPVSSSVSQLNWATTNGSVLVISPVVGTSDVFVGSTTGLYGSTDGTNFSAATAAGLPAGPVTALDTNGTLNLVFAGTPQGLFVSTDGGGTFAATNVTQEVLSVDIVGTPASVATAEVFAGTVNGAWASTGGGTGFAQVAGIPAGAEVFGFTAHASTDVTNANVALVGTSRGVFTSSDAITSFPGTWSATNLSSSVVTSMTSDDSSSPPTDYAASPDGLFQSSDGFNTFVQDLGPGVAAVGKVNGAPSTIYAAATSLLEATVYSRSGDTGSFAPTAFAFEPGTVLGFVPGYVGLFEEFHPIVAQLDPTGSSLLFSSYLSGSSLDLGEGLAIDAAAQNLYVVGATYSSDFPITPTTGPNTVFGTAYNTWVNGFVSKISLSNASPSASATPTPLPSVSVTTTPTQSVSATPTPVPTGSGTIVATPIPTITGSATATPIATPTPLANGAKIAVAPKTENFGLTGVGLTTPASRKLTIRNLSKTGTLAGSFSIIGLNANAFSISVPGFALTAHQKQQVAVTFSPTTLGANAATLVVSSNDQSHPTIDVALKGTAEGGKIVVAKMLKFPPTAVGVTATKQLKIANQGKGPVTLTVGVPNAPFSTSASNQPIGLMPHGKTSIPVVFVPTAKGATPSATLTITVMTPTNPVLNNTISVTLQGTGK